MYSFYAAFVEYKEGYNTQGRSPKGLNV